MGTTIRLPRLTPTMQKGKIVHCGVHIGDKINKQTVLYEIETDKATMEVLSDFEGYIIQKNFSVGETLPIGSLLFVVGERNENPRKVLDEEKVEKIPETTMSPMGSTTVHIGDSVFKLEDMIYLHQELAKILEISKTSKVETIINKVRGLKKRSKKKRWF